MARTRIATSIDLEGPFFTRDPRRTFRQNIRDLMDVVAREGEADVKTQLRQGESTRAVMRGITPARVSGHVVGRTSNLRGKRWQVTANVSVNNRGLTKAQGTTLMAAAATIERRSHVFRRTTTRLRRMRRVAEEALLRGIA